MLDVLFNPVLITETQCLKLIQLLPSCKNIESMLQRPYDLSEGHAIARVVSNHRLHIIVVFQKVNICAANYTFHEKHIIHKEEDESERLKLFPVFFIIYYGL
jgi:hypothetical protein